MICSRCNGTGIVKVSSFVDPTKDLENSCHICKGTGILRDCCNHEDQAQAWIAVSNLLKDHNPYWSKAAPTGLECALQEIRRLQAIETSLKEKQP